MITKLRDKFFIRYKLSGTEFSHFQKIIYNNIINLWSRRNKLDTNIRMNIVVIQCYVT